MVACCPMHNVGVPVTVMVTAAGCITCTAITLTQPLASVTVTAYPPASRSVMVADVCPPGVHEYVNGGVPPATTTVAVPSDPPKHKVGVEFMLSETFEGEV